jgi:signal transduction histidine kinase/ActR/RegA family two-component response regulator
MAAGHGAVFVVTPNAADGEVALELLARHGIAARRGADVRALVQALAIEGTPDAGVGCAVLVEESLLEEDLPLLREALESQPPWRDLPLVVVAREPAQLGEAVTQAFPQSASVTLLARPLSAVTLVSAVQAGLRATRRQLEVAGLIAERERAVRSRDEFLAMLAHELRNPLAPIRNAVELQHTLEHHNPLFAKTRDILERQSAHLSRLVDDLVDVARLERGKMALQRVRVDLNALVAAAIEAALPNVKARGHQVHIDLCAEPLALDADPTRIEQIVANLLTNAAKFTTRPDVIRVATRSERERALVEVRDPGVGFAAGHGEALFGLFVQGEQTLARSLGGLGIGLTIARRLAELHGGSIDAASDGPGRGATFTVRLPLALQTAIAGPANAPVLAREPAHGAPRRVLVIEDSHDIRETMRLLLTQWGHDVAIAASGEEGLESIARERPDVAIIDIGLPGINGYEVARRIRAMPGTLAVRLIALTGYGQPADGRRARESGFDEHLLKPLAPELLRTAVAGEGEATRAESLPR